jgi:hypothetical protein
VKGSDELAGSSRSQVMSEVGPGRGVVGVAGSSSNSGGGELGGVVAVESLRSASKSATSLSTSLSLDASTKKKSPIAVVAIINKPLVLLRNYKQKEV